MKYKIASILLIVLFSLTIIFHFLILIKVIPYAIAWGGRLTNDREMQIFESVSICINAVFLLVSIIKYKQVKSSKSTKLITVFLWIMFALFSLNTIGNLSSLNNYERIIFTPLTLISSIACFILARYKNND